MSYWHVFGLKIKNRNKSLFYSLKSGILYCLNLIPNLIKEYEIFTMTASPISAMSAL